MNGNQFIQLPNVAPPVRRYQRRWQVCLDRKAHSYYWLERHAQKHYTGYRPLP